LPAIRIAVVAVSCLLVSTCRGRDGGDREAALATAADASNLGSAPFKADGAAINVGAVVANPGDGAAQAAALATPIDRAGTIYPRDLPEHPGAARVCDAVHGVAARRKAACCGGEASSFFAAECGRTLGATLHAGNVDVDEAALARCSAAMEARYRTCDAVTPAPLPIAECQRLVRGKLPSGAVCRSSLECVGNLHCEGVSATRTGVCVPAASVGAGCGVHVDVLATYLGHRDLETSHPFCAEFCSLAAHKCEPVPAAGAACVASVNCAPDHLCIAGKCSAAPRAKKGEECGARPCERGLACVSAVCTPLALPGELCSSDEDCERGGCVAGGDGRTVCGAKCSALPSVLRLPDGGPTMRLPSARRPPAKRGD
jgi:hypothetical protein